MAELIGRMLLSVVCVGAISWGAALCQSGQDLGGVPLMLGTMGVVLSFVEGHHDNR